jgi:hypothetical protein
MEGRTMRILSEYIAELHRRDREYYRTTERPSVNTTQDTDAIRSQGNRSGDAGRGENGSRQSSNNL